MNAPILTTQRLILSITLPSQAHQMADYMQRVRLAHAPFNPPAPEGFYTVEYWLKRCALNHEEFDQDRSARYSLRLKEDGEDGPIIGQCNLSNIVRGAFQACHLGYNIAPDHEGRGLMSEAVEAIVELAFGQLNLHRVMANYLPSNERSRRLLERQGFIIEGLAPQYLMIGGKWQDHVLSAKTNHAWRPRQEGI